MRLLDGRSYAYQWDSNIYVILPKAKIGEEIHFAHRQADQHADGGRSDCLADGGILSCAGRGILCDR